MNKIDDGGPAFPVPEPGLETGLTLRDYFAAKALQGAIHHRGFATVDHGRVRDAEGAYAYADAMIAARGAA